MSLFLSRPFPLIAVITCLSRQEVLSYSTHSPVKTDKLLEDVLENLNLSSTITPQMINLGLSQERKSSSIWWDTAGLTYNRHRVSHAANAGSHHVSVYGCTYDPSGFNARVFTVVDEVWHQQAVFRLLQLIELPLLENLLEGKDTSRRPLHGMDSDPDLLYTSSYLDREVLKAFSEAQ